MMESLKDKESKSTFLDQSQEGQLLKSEIMQVATFGEQLNSEKLEGRVTLSQIEEAGSRIRFRIKAGRGIF